MLQDRDETVAVIRSILCRRASAKQNLRSSLFWVMTPSFFLAAIKPDAKLYP